MPITTTQNRDTLAPLPLGLALPLPEHTALELARLGASLPGEDNPTRASLRTVASLLDADPPDLPGAALNARLGVLGACATATHTERPESHLLAACVSMLSVALNDSNTQDAEAVGNPGALSAWRASVGTLCEGNSRLVFALCCGFAGPLWERCVLLWERSAEPAWFEFIGPAGTGKGLALAAAGSVCGGGVHGLRLSAGEPGSVGKLCIPVDAGKGMGVFEALHGHDGPQALADAISEAGRRYAGAAGKAWAQWMALNPDNTMVRALGMLDKCAAKLTPEGVEPQANTLQRPSDMLESCAARLPPEGAELQVSAVAMRFAEVATAGELAIEAGLVPWPAGEAVRAAERCFDAWLAQAH